MKKYIAGISLLILVVLATAFTVTPQKDNTENTNSYFYRYTSTSHTQAAIENRLNYARSTITCNDGEHVCGVYLPNNAELDEPPSENDFNAVVNDLWSSEVAGSAASPDIIMKD